MTREEAIKELSGFIGQLTEGCQEAIKVLIPELAESEDERMIKAIVDALLSHSNSINLLSLRGFQIEDVKAWLEKQKEQKDYRKLYEDIAKSEWFKKAYEGKSLGCDEEQKEQKPEWNEEDDAHLKRLCRIIHNQVVNKRLSLAEESELGNWMDKWLNHKPQSHWKPSEEQIDALDDAIDYDRTVFRRMKLVSLLEDLKKLM